MNHDANEKRVFACGCIVEWHLDKCKFTDCAAHSDKEIEVRSVGYTNVDFRKGDIESRIPVDHNSVDVVISNCVINLTLDKVNAFKEIHRILKHDGGRMVISDLVTSNEIAPTNANAEKWNSCIDGALTKKHYIDSIRQAGFQNIEVLNEQLYVDDDYQEEGNQQDSKTAKRKITSVVIKAVK